MLSRPEGRDLMKLTVDRQVSSGARYSVHCEVSWALSSGGGGEAIVVRALSTEHDSFVWWAFVVMLQ